jgi:DNA methylase/ParB-like nuclease domain
MTTNQRFAGANHDRSRAASSERIVLRAVGSLKPNPRNARTHSKRQIRQLANSIKAMGFIGAIIIDENDMILAGHARSKASELLGMSLVPTIRVSGLNEAQKRAFVLADNKIPENAGWDREILAAELGGLAELLPAHDWNLSLTGFEPAEIDALFADEDSKRDPADTLPALVDHVVTRSGDRWCLGRHRLLCGDACSVTSLHRLMGDARARMVFADVPYNVEIGRVQGRGRIKHPEFAYASGELTKVQYVHFLREALGNAAGHSINGAVHYVCIDWRHVEELIAAGHGVYSVMLNLCVWAKTNAGQGSFYRSQHELIGVFRVGTEQHQNNVELGRFGRNRSNLWTYAGANGFGTARTELLRMHPTVKPIALVADAMRDCTTKGDVVLDPFLGSGTTMLAAEKIGRRGYGLEFEPRYVDVSIRRWQAYTKLEAVLEGDGRTFAELEAERMAPKSANADVPKTLTISGGNRAHHGADWLALCDEVKMILAKGEVK